ncbi:MAG: DUF4258 domain-containing protein [Phycisphaeraceae bacterium]
MNRLLRAIQDAVRQGRVEIADHALERFLERDVDIEETIEGVQQATLLEDYSVTRQEPRILVAQRESSGRVIHVVWEAPTDTTPDAVIVTVIRPQR